MSPFPRSPPAVTSQTGTVAGRGKFCHIEGRAACSPDSGETAPIAGPRGRLRPRPRSDRTAHASPAASPPNLNLLLKYAPLLSPFSRTPSAPARSQGQVHRAIPSAGHGDLRAHLPRPAGGGGRRRARGREQAAEQAAAAAAAPVRARRAAPRLLLRRHGPRHPRLPPPLPLHHHRHVLEQQQRGAPGGGGAGVAAVPLRRRCADGVRGGRRRRAARPRAAGAEAQGPARGGDRRRRFRGQPPGGPPPGARRQRDRGGQLLHGAQGERGAPRRQPQLRDDPARRRRADPAGGGPDLPPGLPGLPRALQVQPRQDHQDQRGGHAQHARPRQARRRPLPPHQHQRGLRRPPPAPPGRDLLGQRQPHRCSELLRRGQEDGGDIDHGLPPRRQPRGEDRADLQHLRAAHVHRRWPGRQQLCRSGTEEGAPDGVRRRQADEELPVRLRSGRGSDEADGGGSRGAVQPGEPGGVHDAGAGQGGAGHHRPQRADRVPGQHRRRPAQAQAGHHQGQGAARVGAQGGAPQRPPAHGPGLPHPHLRRPQAAAAAATRRRRVIRNPFRSSRLVM